VRVRRRYIEIGADLVQTVVVYNHSLDTLRGAGAGPGEPGPLSRLSGEEEVDRLFDATFSRR
jgi:hypothetical protein